VKVFPATVRGRRRIAWTFGRSERTVSRWVASGLMPVSYINNVMTVDTTAFMVRLFAIAGKA
jgi:hypothetical protein